MTAPDNKTSYHHGGLHDSLLQAAMAIIQESGVDGLSMRKLADRVGVSRTAPYHHFRDKQALLSELALKGFREYSQQIDAAVSAPGLSAEQQLERFVRGYLRFALDHPEAYSLMFGQAIWKSGQPSDRLHTEAYAAFQAIVDRVSGWQAEGVLPADAEALRFAQVVWSTLHGLSRLVIDGIYVESDSIEAITTTLLSLLRQQFPIRCA